MNATLTRARDSAVWTAKAAVRAPLTIPAATALGAHRTGQRLKSWILAEDYRQSSRAAGTWHKDAHAHRAMEKENAVITLGLIGVLLLSAGLLWWLAPRWVHVTLLGALWVYLLFKGRRRLDKPQARTGPGLLGLTAAQLHAAFEAAGVIKKDQQLHVATPPHRSDRGVAMTIDLPAGVTAAGAQKARVRLASALGLDEAGLVLSGVRGAQGHAARLSVWAMAGDPWDEATGEHPLLDEPRTNAWRANPYGVDARGRVISLRLPGSHVLVGAAPNAGKTFAGRSLALPYVLDPDVRLLIANGKGDDAWDALREAAHTYVRGDDDTQVLTVSRMLDALIADIRDRNTRKVGSALTEAQARDVHARMPLTLLVIDEAQEYLGCASADPDSDDKKATLGKSISTKLTKLGKLARSAGLVIVVLTQRPSEESLPKDLRAVLMTRFALRTRDRHNSDMILGPEFASRGYCTAPNEEGADDGLPNGVGILVPDPGAHPDAAKGYPTLRTFLVTDESWELVGRKAAALRGNRGHGEDPGDGGPGPVPEPTPEPVQDDDVSLPENVIQLREYLARPGNEFRGSKELQAELGMSSPDFNHMMRGLGLEQERSYVEGQDGKVRCWGYFTNKVLRAIEALDAERDEPGDAA